MVALILAALVATGCASDSPSATSDEVDSASIQAEGTNPDANNAAPNEAQLELIAAAES